MNLFSALIVCFFFSGATALIYEVVWVRLLALTFGSSVYAIGVVLTAFMSGLTMGSWLFGKWSDRRGVNLLRWYGYLEIGIAVLALSSPILLSNVTSFYLSLSPTDMDLWKLSGLRYLLSMLVVILPTILMGGTLPILSRFFIRSEAQLESRLGALYALNTMGGVVGTFLVGFFLIKFYGISLTITIAAMLNLAIGILALYLGRGGVGVVSKQDVQEDEQENEIITHEPVSTPSGYNYAGLAFCLSGLAAMVYQVAWNRLLVAVIGSATFAFSLILMGILLGIGLGSLAVSRISKRKNLNLKHFAIVQVMIGLLCYLGVFLMPILPELMKWGLVEFGNSYTQVLGIEFVIVLIFLLVPTTLMGSTFPIIAGIYSGGTKKRGTNIGRIYAANTAGAILGSALAAFILVPFWGSVVSIKLAALLNISLGGIGFFVLGKKRQFAVVMMLMIIPLIPFKLAPWVLDSGVAIYGKGAFYNLNPKEISHLYQKEGLNATISITADYRGTVSLRTNGKSDASQGSDMSTQLALGYFPGLLHKNPEDFLVVGFGSGVTARAVSEFPSTKSIDVVEIEPAVLETKDYFKSVNWNITDDPRVSVIIDDARSYVVASDKNKYDVIISEPSNPWISGIANLFSREFYSVASDSLRADGIFCQWVQLYRLRPADFKMIVNTFSTVFPNTTIWRSSYSDVLLIGKKGKLTTVDNVYDLKVLSDRINELASPDMKAYLYIDDPIDMLTYRMVAPKGVKYISTDAPLNTDDKPLLEFNSPFSMYAENTTLDNSALMAKVSTLPKVNSAEQLDFDYTSEYFYRKSNIGHLQKMPIDAKWIERAMMSYPSDPKFRVQWAKQMENEQGITPQGIAMLSEVLKGYPENYSALMELGRVSLGKEDGSVRLFFKEAMRVAEKSNFKDVKFNDYLDLGLFLLSRGLNEDALAYLLRAEAMPHQLLVGADLRYNIGVALIRLERYSEAKKVLEKSYSANSFSFDTIFALGDVELFSGNKQGACKIYKSALPRVMSQQMPKLLGRIGDYCVGM